MASNAAKDCGTLEAPGNGAVSVTKSTLGGTATYSCKTGYLRSGDEVRTCQATGRWSGTSASCQGNVSDTICLFSFGNMLYHNSKNE